MGLDAFVNPADISQAMQLHDKHVYDNMCPFLVKIYASSRSGQPAGEFSGFLYNSSSPAIVSAGHMVGFSGDPPGTGPSAEVFKARYFDGFEEDVEVLKAAANSVPDVAILRGSRPAPRSLLGVMCSTGDTVYALGFSPKFNNPRFSKGIVSSGTVGSVAITAHADNGYSGGPVVNVHGQLVGIIKGGLGTSILQVGITPAEAVHGFLLKSGQPGLA
ncbi:hypothetical protein TSOC_004249 [Tetrabaena socialis]|uniref:Uncharacterized protein n=1 Tax=Tetrabaena socialis TaxID=47790 RepID=A0A2J8A9C0_9CHLO|nr:hypothetical protein TSOC_004249 [Tetrabaena socialis]|eukprot:PNH09128.1 hypothetical protein TSOC_004249 [Tetrabaena socialis]